MKPGIAPAQDFGAVVASLRARMRTAPRVHLLLGSGLSGLERLVDVEEEVPFGEIPGLPSAGIAGHAGHFLFGRCEGVPVVVQCGRLHFYEGHPPWVIAAPARIAAALGARSSVITAAVGGVDTRLRPGGLVVVDDHINLLARTPLPPPAHAGNATPFPDMSAPYDPELQQAALAEAARLGVRLARGTYAALLGPTFETPAEVRMVERMGGDVVGMSVVPEVLTLRARGVRVLAFAMVTNMACGVGMAPGAEGADAISHEEVLEVGNRAGAVLERVIRGMLAGGAFSV